MSESTDPAYLCQVSRHVSCGACCGLYNVADASYAGLRNMLADRSARFAETPRRIEAIQAFQEQNDQQVTGPPPLPDFHHCPFLGLIGHRQSRVGCLLHPAAAGNDGIDFRGLSYYGALACRTYFCPSCDLLTADIKRIVKAALNDWYTYGLVITESRMLVALFGEISRRLGRKIRFSDIHQRPDRVAAMGELLRIKLNWPFRKHPRDGWCHYFFNDRRHGRPALNPGATRRPPVRYAALFEELVSYFPGNDHIDAAERLIDELLDRLITAVSN